MSHFLRDEFLKSLTITEGVIDEINKEIINISTKRYEQLKQNHELKEIDKDKKYLLPRYIIRFDGKGFQLYDFEIFKEYFRDAKQVERVIFILDSMETSPGILGEYIEIRFDANDINNCIINVQGNDKGWVDANFSNLKDIINKCKNYNWFFTSRWAVIVIQILGVLSGFTLSLWIAYQVAPHLLLEHRFIFAFIAAFLIFSNLWAHIFEGILRLGNKFFPNIHFGENKLRRFLPVILVSVSLWVVGKLILYLWDSLSKIIQIN